MGSFYREVIASFGWVARNSSEFIFSRFPTHNPNAHSVGLDQAEVVIEMHGFYESHQFEIASILEENWLTIKQELNQLQQGDFLPWPEEYLYGKGWDVFGLYAFGLKIGKNCDLCPETTKIVETVPNLTTVGFSSLAPRTYIAPHTGYPDGLLRCHLGLMVPDGCGIRVGTETRMWEEGKCLIFDDTLEHEAWNQGNKTRVILLIDFKAPAGILKLPERHQKKSLFSMLGWFKKTAKN